MLSNHKMSVVALAYVFVVLFLFVTSFMSDILILYRCILTYLFFSFPFIFVCFSFFHFLFFILINLFHLFIYFYLKLTTWVYHRTSFVMKLVFSTMICLGFVYWDLSSWICLLGLVFEVSVYCIMYNCFKAVTFFNFM